MLHRWGFILGIAALAVVLPGCDDGGPGPAEGVVQGIVMVDGTGIPDVTVELAGNQVRESATDQDGRYVFDEVADGAYVVSIREAPSDASFSATSRTAVVSGRQTVTVDFTGNFIRTSSISGVVRAGGGGLSGVTVVLTGTQSGSTETDSDGEFAFTGLRAGEYRVEISGYPPRVSFNSTGTNVTLDAGDNHFVNFDGDPELTASVVIRGITRRESDGSIVSVDPSALRGRVEVAVGLDRGEDTVERVDLLLDETLVGSQEFGSGDEHAADAGEDAVQEILFSLNSGAFDEETGEPRFPNGDRLLRARLTSREGGEGAFSSSIPVSLRNVDTFGGEVRGDRGQATGDDGESWIGGRLEVTVLPVLYSERSLDEVSVELRRTGGSRQAFRRADVPSEPGPVTLIFEEEESESGNVAGYQTPADGTDQVRVVGAVRSDGSEFPELPFILAEDLRIDNRPPEPSDFVLPIQGSSEPCCSSNWVGVEHEFRRGVGEVVDTGVGDVDVIVYAGPADLSDEEILDLDSVERGGELEPTGSNDAYRAVAVLTDGLKNRRIVTLSSNAANPGSSASGAVFGVDHKPPVAAFAASASIPDRAVNPPAGEGWVLEAIDDVSGIPAAPARASVERIHPSLPGSRTCVFPAGSQECTSAADGLSRVVPSSQDGYFVYRAYVLDRAGNRSEETFQRIAVRDGEAPQVSLSGVPDAPEGGEEETFQGAVSDDVDLHRAWLRVLFGTQAGDRWMLPLGATRTLGSPFEEGLVTSASPSWTKRFIRSLEHADGGSEGHAPSEQVRGASAVRLGAEDAAGNVGADEVSVQAGGAGPSFSVGSRGESEGVASWRSETAGGELCLHGALCPEGSLANVTLTARAEGAGGGFQNPFDLVVFYVVDADGRWTEAGRAEEGHPHGDGWRWQVEWAPADPLPEGEVSVVPVGVDETGAALRASPDPALTMVVP